MAGYSRDSNRWRDPDEDEQRCHKESTANAEQARNVANRKTHPQHEEYVYGQISNGKIDLQDLLSGVELKPSWSVRQ